MTNKIKSLDKHQVTAWKPPFRFFESIRVSGEQNRNRHRKPNNLILGTETENRIDRKFGLFGSVRVRFRFFGFKCPGLAFSLPSSFHFSSHSVLWVYSGFRRTEPKPTPKTEQFDFRNRNRKPNRPKIRSIRFGSVRVRFRFFGFKCPGLSIMLILGCFMLRFGGWIDRSWAWAVVMRKSASRLI